MILSETPGSGLALINPRWMQFLLFNPFQRCSHGPEVFRGMALPAGYLNDVPERVFSLVRF